MMGTLGRDARGGQEYELESTIRRMTPGHALPMNRRLTTSTSFPLCSRTDVLGKYVPRMWLSNLLSGVATSIDYDWKDDGADPTNCEDNFGR